MRKDRALKMNRKLIQCGLATLFLLVSGPGLAKPSGTPDLATDLARLRSEVESLSSEIDLEKEETRNILRTLASQRSELEAEKRRSALRLAELERLKAKMDEEAALQSEAKEFIGPAVASTVAPLTKEIDQGLPFRTLERKASLQKIADQLKEGSLTPGGALARIWGHVEDELRLARESGLYKQVIQLEGKDILTDVTRVGMMMLFFQTPDGKTGRAIKNGQEWTYLTFDEQTPSGKESADQVRRFQDAMVKQIRTGFFQLPMAFFTQPQGGTSK